MSRHDEKVPAAVEIAMFVLDITKEHRGCSEGQMPLLLLHRGFETVPQKHLKGQVAFYLFPEFTTSNEQVRAPC